MCGPVTDGQFIKFQSLGRNGTCVEYDGCVDFSSRHFIHFSLSISRKLGILTLVCYLKMVRTRWFHQFNNNVILSIATGGGCENQRQDSYWQPPHCKIRSNR